MKRSVAAHRHIFESKPNIERPKRIWIGERHLIDGEPVVVTGQREDGEKRILEGWHATTGELLAWHWYVRIPTSAAVAEATIDLVIPVGESQQQVAEE
jgi:hypothetical protein